MLNAQHICLDIYELRIILTTIQADEEVDDQDDRPTQRRRRAGDEDSEGASEEAGGAEGDGSIETQLIKKLVRYALACEYSRTPIRREGIRDKGKGHH